MTVVALCEHHDDARQLRLALLEELHRLVPFQSFAWLLTDPSSEVGTAPIADVPCLPDLPRLIRLKYATVTNRWTHQSGPVARLHDATGGALEQSTVWREILADHHVSDVMSVVFRDPFGCWAFLDLWRYSGVFTEAQAGALAEHVGTITAALRRCTLRTLSLPTQRGDRPRWPGPVVLVLSEQLAVQRQTPDTERYLRALIPPEGTHPAIPASAYNVAAQLLALEAGIDDHQPIARVHLDNGEWLTLRAARIGEDIAVTIERASPADRLDLLARSAQLTVRETELLQLLATGAGTRALAAHMFLSEHTVQDHLKAIFAKTGANSRRDLLARAICP